MSLTKIRAFAERNETFMVWAGIGVVPSLLGLWAVIPLGWGGNDVKQSLQPLNPQVHDGGYVAHPEHYRELGDVVDQPQQMPPIGTPHRHDLLESFELTGIADEARCRHCGAKGRFVTHQEGGSQFVPYKSIRLASR